MTAVATHPVPDDQRDTIAFLGRPTAYGSGIDRVETIETHVSVVFLAGEQAYKLKRAVRLPYLDFSTVAQRRDACAAELALNRRTAPALYLGLRRLGRNPAGEIGFFDGGTEVDWVVVMRRFDQSLLFDQLARAGKLAAPALDALADHIAEFHAAAEPRPDQGGAAALDAVAEENRRCLAAAARAGFEKKDIAAIREKWRGAVDQATGLLERRRAGGKVRRCHGDLHLRNICLFDGQPTLFDCLEFSEPLASIDILYDLAFLLMDLEHRGLGAFANRVLNRYLDRTGEDDGLAAMPLFLSLRAGIRAHVTATALEHADSPETAAEAHRYLDLAQRSLEPQPPRLVAIGGPSGSGKSTLALALAPELGPLPGARVLRSDVARKLLFGVAPETRLPQSAYTAQVTRRVYERLARQAATALAAGYSAIIDAVALTPKERCRFAEIARRAGAPFIGLWLDADAAAMAARIGARRNDASDATAAILARQLRRDPGPIDWTRIDAGGDPQTTLAAARRALA